MAGGDDPDDESSTSTSGSSNSDDDSSDDDDDDDRDRDKQLVHDLETDTEWQIDQLDDGTTYDRRLYDKLISFDLSEVAVQRMIRNGVATVVAFALLFDGKALDLLFKKEGLDQLPVLVEQRVRLFHKWLRQCRDRGVNLKKVDLSRFDDFTMASLLDSKEAESAVRGRPGTPKDSGLVLPTFGGGQGSFKVFDTKFRAFLCQNKNEEGKPLIYVIANYKKESKTIQRQIKGVKLRGAQFDRDNFKVAQWLESALADGTALVYAETNPGDGRRGYQALYSTYKSRSNRDTRAQEIRLKLKALQYRGTKNYPWEKFRNTLFAYYAELKMLKQKVSHAQQVRDLLTMIVHEKTRAHAVEVMMSDKKAKHDLQHALALIGDRNRKGRGGCQSGR
jgi:hypothetical protein